ncbi:MAG: SufD family Fe-S cluster assembly protein [Deltaproteobacteria bacterium]|nr:SufD family Fe-S cluster assembly protein [Deltaproteobacteria bacterium]
MTSTRRQATDAAMSALSARFEEARPGRSNEPVWLSALRSSAFAALEANGLPRPNDEDFRYTDVRSILQELVKDLPRSAESSTPERELPWIELSASGVTQAPGLPAELSVLPLSAVDPRAKGRDLGAFSIAPTDQAFAALPLAFAPDGALITAEARVGEPIEVSIAPGARHAPVWVDLRPGSKLTLVLSIRTLADGFSSALARIRVGRGAQLALSIRTEAGDGAHVTRVEAEVLADAKLDLFTLDARGRTVRNETQVSLAEPGASASLSGLYIVGPGATVDHHTTLRHKAPRATSRQNYRGIVLERGSAGFTGRVIVDPNADGTDAAQSSKNLLLSENGTANTRPQLEIYARDVKCSHGATVGQLDPEQLFYLTSRGIARSEARKILTFAFGAELVGLREDPRVRATFTRVLLGAIGASPELLMESP